ncbi:MAG TPA: SDR family oxidoreductase [Desulfobacteraceae bacterium]|nr:SDR family oxidoreductase [Deltaproteobacteria bacterium]MBW2356980.1 SDR family oxidoreductase [Deltaproteobacteria bacterium]RLB96686.1 MAG: short chain dehydrogenase [Deltaproteobacteria bacterium]HDI60831.1 SDR family oxidoreductase [Desulfobacteraceae bacterium]
MALQRKKKVTRVTKVKKFQDKVAVITGGASGIGLALARRFARGGARLGLLDMDAEALQREAARLAGGGTEVVAAVCDVSARRDCQAGIDAVLGRFGRIDVLVNNAGITARDRFVDTRAEVFERVMAVNFFGSLYCTQAALASLRASRGLIVVVESLAGVSPLLGRSAYCASKHALHGLFTTLRAELRPDGVQVMIACPGFVQTNLQRRALGGDGRVTARPQSRVGRQTSAAAVADILYRAALRRRPMVVLTPVGKIAYWVSRLMPLTYERLMARQFAVELSREARRP